MSTEVELKLELEQKDLRRLRRNPVLAGALAHSESQLTIYYDTPKAKLRKAGFSLRVRSTDGAFIQTIKPLKPDAGLYARDEWEKQVDTLHPDLCALNDTPLEALGRRGLLKKLHPVVRSEVRRTVWLLHQENSSLEIALDEGSVAAGEFEQEFTELELELLSGDRDGLVHMARQIADRIPVRIGVLSKAERGFALADGSLGKVSKASPVHVHPDMSVGEAFTVVVHACLKHFRLNEPVVLATRDAAALHQARVAMRRLRSAFTLFKPAVADDEYGGLREELRWFTAQLGEARNLDVYLERETVGKERRQLTRRREKAYSAVIASLSSPRFLLMVINLVAWIPSGRWRSSKKAKKPIVPFAAKRLDALWKGIGAKGAGFRSMDEATRHALRIQIKKLRYALEFFSGLYASCAREQKRFAQAVEGLQESLGHLNDLVTARELSAAVVPAAALADRLHSNEEEHRLLALAEGFFRKLMKIGPYWRTP